MAVDCVDIWMFRPGRWLAVTVVLVLMLADGLHCQPNCTASWDVTGDDGQIYCYAASSTALQTFPSISVSRWSTVVFSNLSFSPRLTIKTIQQDAFSGLRVRELLLRQLNITNVSRLAFRGASVQLTDIVLESNALRVIESGTFSMLGTSNVISISLASNGLTSLDPNTFANMSSLQFIYLSNNALTQLPDSLLASTRGLLAIWLNGNRLTTIPARLFRGLTQLTWIQLSDNSITTLDANSFVDQPGLSRLFLQNNALSDLPPMLLKSLGPDLQILDISNNTVASLPVAYMQNLTGLQYLGLSGNTMNCSDNVLISYLQQLNSNGDAVVSLESCSAFLTTPVPTRGSTASSSIAAAVRTTPAAAVATPTQPPTTTTTTTTAAEAKSSPAVPMGLVIGVVVGVVGGCAVIIAIIVALVFFRRRQLNAPTVQRDRNMTQFSDDAAASGFGGGDSTKNLFYRIGSTRAATSKSLFSTSSGKQPQQVRVPKQGVDVVKDGSPETGDEDVSTAAKPGMKVVMNTSIVPQLMSTAGCEDC